MDIFLVNPATYKRTHLLDRYSSFIWTERMSDYGDFEMVFAPSSIWDELIIGRYVGHSKTNKLMIIEERLETEDSEGGITLTIRGRSLESLLLRRVVIPPAGKGVWSYSGPAGNAVYYLVRLFAILETDLGQNRDVIPDMYMYNGTADTEVLEFAISPKSLYDSVKEICDSRNFTFGIELMAESPRLRCFVDDGLDRPIYFSTDLDTLSETSALESDMDYYNTAYVWSKDGKYRTVVNASSTVHSGVNRRVLSVDESSLDVSEDVTVSQLLAQLKQRGKEELSKHKKFKSFDGKLTGHNPYIYRKHYFLGDRVTLKGARGLRSEVRISEYIFTSDSEGDRDYPTFTVVD